MHDTVKRSLRVLRKVWKTVFLYIPVLLILFLGYAIFLESYTARINLPATFGNFDRVRKLLKDTRNQKEFSFVVAGDTRGYGTFERISECLKKEPLSFMVLLGDCVRNGTPGYHRYLKAEMAEEPAMPFPEFYVVGDNDIDTKNYPLSRFEQTYGPTNFSFEYSGCLFIVLRILPYPYSTKESFAFLEKALSAGRHTYRKVFVFTHRPPPVLPSGHGADFENSDDFFALCERLHVDYVISGNYHGYFRTKVGDTVYLVTGGGGAHLQETLWDRFHHVIRITVEQDSVAGQDSVTEQMFFLDHAADIEDLVECIVLAHIVPFVRRNLVLSIVIMAAIFIVCFFMMYRFLKRHYLLLSG